MIKTLMHIFEKLIIFLIILSIPFSLMAQEDRLKELIRKDVNSKLSGGKGLTEQEKKEYDKLGEKTGTIETAKMTSQIISEIKNGQSGIKVINQSQQASNTVINLLPLSPLLENKSSSARVNILETSSPKVADQKDNRATKDIKTTESQTDNTVKADGQNITLVINTGNPALATPEDIRKSSTNSSTPETDQEEKPKLKSGASIPKKIEDEMLQNYKVIVEEASQKQKTEDAYFNNNSKVISNEDPYKPSPTGQSISNPSFKIERDSTSVITTYISPNDVITIHNCVADGVSIQFGDSIKTTISKHIKADDKYFEVEPIQGDRAVFARLTKPVVNGAWYSSVKLYRKDNNLVYVINLVGIPCPKDILRFPKVVYLEERQNRNSRIDDGLKMSDSTVLTPRDKIIQESNGFKESNEYNLRVDDMVASAGVNVVSMGVTADNISAESNIEFKTLDFHQVTNIKTSSQYLALQSKTYSEMEKKSVLHWNLTINIKKDYMVQRRFIYLMLIDNKKKQYQYLRVDTAEKLLSLKGREYDL